jgi:hypothetical protein
MSIAISGSTITFADLTTQSSAAVAGGTFKNRIINGDFRIWQRGTTISNPLSTNFYTADRWGCNRAADVSGAVVSRIASGLTGFEFALALQRVAGNTGTEAISLWYSAESSDVYDLADNQVTLSFWAKTGANFSGGSSIGVIIYSGTGTDQRVYNYTGIVSVASTTQAITSTWTRYTLTGTVPANATELGLQFNWVPSGTAGADDSVKFAGVQLERGGSASTFETRAIGSELALCQRYYLKKAALTINGLALAGNAVVTNVQQDFPDTFPTMRSSPVASVSAASDFTIYVAAVTRTATNLQAANTSPSSCWWITQNNNIGQTVAVTLYASNANAFLQYNSEL